MTEISNTMAKLSGIRKSLAAALDENIGRVFEKGGRKRDHYPPDLVEHYFSQAAGHVEKLRRLLPDLYGDLHFVHGGPDTPMATTPPSSQYSRSQLERLARDVDQIFEIRANSELEQPKAKTGHGSFVSHGRSNDWREVQAFIEKDVGLPTIELQQQPSKGRTVIEKLAENAEHCDSAVIVMTGDDLVNEDEARVRENVMHEIGYFQAKYGRDRVVLLHEDGVNIPSNLSGIVYIPYPKGNVSAGLHVLQRELTAMYKPR